MNVAFSSSGITGGLTIAEIETDAGRQPERQSITTPEKELCVAAVPKNNL